MNPDFNTIHTKLQPALQQLENQRLELKAKGNKTGLTAGGICLFLGTVFLSVTAGFSLGIVIVPAIIALIIWYNCIAAKSGILSAFYKQNIIAAILSELCEESSFQPNSGITEQAFMASGLFSKTPDRYHSEDAISGRIDKTRFVCSEVKAEEEQVTTDSKGNTSTRWVDIFSGFFFIADFQKDFRGQTVIYRDSWFKWGNSGQRVKLENPEFEKRFDTYTTDQVEARYILTPTLMEKLMELDRKFPGQITLSFLDSKVIIAIPDSKNHFETSIWQSQLNNNSIFQEFHTLSALLGIVDDLNLNLRIWSKE